MFEIMTFIVLISAVGGGVLALEVALALEGVLRGERVRAHRGCQDEDPMSRFQGGDLAPSCDCPAVISLLISVFIFLFI
jgi:hypothetical protein